jgi:hypothetical protein
MVKEAVGVASKYYGLYVSTSNMLLSWELETL